MPPARPPPPCKEPACESRSEAFKATMAAATASKTAQPVCPPDRDELGRHSWTLLHTVAAYYPEMPTASEKAAASHFVRSLSSLYPCKECAHDMAEAIEQMPPRIDSRADFSIWMCELHNHVNAKIGKPAFRCNLKELDEAWRTASRACELAQGKAHGEEAIS